MNKKLYEKRLIEGKILVKNYISSMYALCKFIFNTLNEFPELTVKQLASDIKINGGTGYKLRRYYEKNLSLFGKKENETTFLVLVKAEKLNNVSLVNLTKNLEASLNKVKSNYNKLTSNERLELEKVYQRLQDIIEGTFQIVA